MALASDQSADIGEGPIKVQRGEGGIFRITLDNPPANSLSVQVLDTLFAVLAEAGEDDEVRVIVIAALGHLFSAGHDIKELTQHRGDPDRGRQFFELTLKRCSEVMMSVVNHPKPVIAEVSGLATAAGCQLAASCDLVFASEGALFQTPGVHIGLFCSTPMVALSRSIGNKHAMEMLLMGEAISAKRAYEIGLVNRVVPEAELSGAVSAAAQIIASKSQLTLKIGKQAFYRQSEMSLADAYDYAARVMTENLLARDAEEGMGAFLEKRTPDWQGR